ncbi:type 1 fimbrial protein [Pseudomonas sp. AOB-7]|uniref:fimbrial protein n=1 Tax=Pseudomonas sp. AOB-7 TaxID=2482750 RepID=UPI000EFB3037|nr:fimbrial protein [Pseudomonas sp. AOB-7]RMH82372.1 type 1 fimbrial protein [Pseudomonas sp. AOB-7]
MKKFAAVMVLGAGLVGSFGASASDGTITIMGEVVDASCDISVNGGTADATVVLPTVSKTVLAAPGDVAGATAVNLALTNCPVSGSVRAYFEAHNVDQATGYLRNNAAATPAGNVQVQVADAAGSGIDLRDNVGNTFVAFTDDGGVGSANLNYMVQYIATGASTAGLVETALVYSLDYQ